MSNFELKSSWRVSGAKTYYTLKVFTVRSSFTSGVRSIRVVHLALGNFMLNDRWIAIYMDALLKSGANGFFNKVVMNDLRSVGAFAWLFTTQNHQLHYGVIQRR